MSHFTTIKTANIVDAKAFVAACRELGFDGVLTHNTTIKDMVGKRIQVDLAIKVGDYDIGLVKNAAGTYDVVADWYVIRNRAPQALVDAIGATGRNVTQTAVQNAIVQFTTKHTIVDKYKKLGYRAKVRVGDNRELVVSLSR